MLEKFSLEAQKIIAIAESLAFDFASPFIGREHLFLSLLKTADTLLSIELKKEKITYQTVLADLTKGTIKDEEEVYFMEYTTSLKALLERAIVYSKDIKEEKVSVEVLSLMLLSENEGVVHDFLTKKKVNKKEIMANITKATKRKSELDNLTDLHELSKSKKDPLIGRENELDQLIRALKRRNKPNALLVGAPGIGKTAIVEELSSLLMQNKIKGLENKRIYELDMSSVVGGTKYRGEFEEKLKKIIRKVKEDGHAILFIDEIHNIVKAGGAEGAIDASNILKPYLSRGEIQLIGATTIDEYHATIAKDKALNRRFQIIKVDPSSPMETKRILHALLPLYEKYYQIQISSSLADYIVEIAQEYLPSRHFPDKAIDILDNSCVIAKKNLTKSDIEKTMDSFYHVSVQIYNRAEQTRNALQQNIFGQDQAIEKVYKWIHMLEKGVRIPSKPLAVLFFAGPSGVGKSETAKIIAKNFLQHEDAFIRLDMASYQDAASINKMIGSPPGYVGYEEKTSFVKQLTAHPNAVVLLDEIDKAHVDVCDFFLNVFDDGYFLDATQEKIDCTNMIFILTSNQGFDQNHHFSHRLQLCNQEQISQDMYKVLSSKFRLEFLNRIDEIIVFDYLSLEAKNQLIRKYKKDLNYLQDTELGMMIEPLEITIDDSDLHRFGARSVRRSVIQKISELLEREEKEKIK